MLPSQPFEPSISEPPNHGTLLRPRHTSHHARVCSSKAAEHEARLLACALPALRLLRHCLGRLSDAGAQPPVGPLDTVGALLDFEVGKGYNKSCALALPWLALCFICRNAWNVGYDSYVCDLRMYSRL